MAGYLYIVSAPSGAGKTTLVRLLLENDPGIRLSISYTTRAPRSGELDGREYHFVSVPDFQAKIASGDFLEWAEVHGNFYGTSKSWIEAEMASGRDVLLEIDWQGAQQVRKVSLRRLVFLFCRRRLKRWRTVFRGAAPTAPTSLPVAWPQHGMRCGR